MRVDKADASDLRIFGSLRRSACPEGRFIGDGARVLRRMIECGVVIERVLLTPRWLEVFEEHLQGRDAEVRVASNEELATIVGFKLHQGVMAMARIPEPRPLAAIVGSKRAPLVVALDGVSSAENVGAVVRGCAAFGVDALVAGSQTCSPWLRRCVRTSMGAVLSVPVHETEDLAATIRRAPELAWYAAHIHGEKRALRDVDLTGPTGLVVGGEARGVSAAAIAACRATVYIPMSDGWDCLNAAAATAVVLYEAARQRST